MTPEQKQQAQRAHEAELKQMKAERDSNAISVKIIQANRDEWERSWGDISRERDFLRAQLSAARTAIEAERHEITCRWVDPDFLSTEEIAEAQYRCTCWKSRALAELKTNVMNEEPIQEITHYVVGFMFNEAKTAVALIRKAKPEWQKGKLNGIGGKIEPSESPGEAMAREFHEETGALTDKHAWRLFVVMSDDTTFQVYCFATTGELHDLKSPEEEQVEIVYLTNIDPLRGDMIENIPWLVPMALDHLEDGRPSFVKVCYPPTP